MPGERGCPPKISPFSALRRCIERMMPSKAERNQQVFYSGIVQYLVIGEECKCAEVRASSTPELEARGLSLPLHASRIIPWMLPDETIGCLTAQPVPRWANIFTWQAH